jgi:hypothetical protein
LFDIVKRVLTYSLRSGAGWRASVREHGCRVVPRPDGVKRVLIAEFVRHGFFVRQDLPAFGLLEILSGLGSAQVKSQVAARR